MKTINNVVYANKNCVLGRKVDGLLFGNQLTLAYRFSEGGKKLPKPVKEYPRDYEDVYPIDIGDLTYHYNGAESYSELATKLIRLKYPLDAELALAANLRIDCEKYKSEDEAFQQWRALSKEKAREAIGKFNEL